jgi:hypothetical protein
MSDWECKATHSQPEKDLIIDRILDNPVYTKQSAFRASLANALRGLSRNHLLALESLIVLKDKEEKKANPLTGEEKRVAEYWYGKDENIFG